MLRARGSTDRARRPVLSTIRGDRDPAWAAEVDVFRNTGNVAWWLLCFLVAARGRRAIVVIGTTGWKERYRDQLAALLVRLVYRRTRIIVSDASIEPQSATISRRSAALGRLVPAVSRGLIRAIDAPGVTWCVLSNDERSSFASTWGVSPQRVVFTAYKHSLGASAEQEPAKGGYVFSGGNTRRDHDLLVRALGGEDMPVVVATTGRVPEAPNITAGAVSREKYIDLLRGCALMVLCLQPSVYSVGLQTCMDAMVLAKPLIVTDALGIRDYVEHGVTGVVVPPEPSEIRSAVRDAMDPSRADHYTAMGRRAREAVLARFTDADYRARLLALALSREPVT